MLKRLQSIMCHSASKNILILANSSWYLLNFRSSLIKSFIGLGHNVYFYAPDNGSNKDLRSLGALPLFPKITNQQRLLLVELMKGDLQNLRSIDFIFSFNLKANIFSWVFKKFSKRDAKRVATITGQGNLFLVPFVGKYLNLFINQLFLFSCFHIFVQNSDDLCFFGKMKSKAQITKINGSGVDLTRFSQASISFDGIYRILVASRFLDNKGLKELFTAVLNLSHLTKKQFLVLYAGELEYGRASKRLLRLFERAKGNANLRFLGKVEEMPELIANCHAALLPSYREGLSKFLLEAAAVGRPLLVSNVPGCRDLVEQYDNGIIFEPRSSKDIEVALLKFMDLEFFEIQQMGKNSRKLAEKYFSDDAVNMNYLEFVKC